MRQPDVRLHDSKPAYIELLFDQLRELGRTKRSVCKQIGLPERTLRDYTNPDVATEWDYRTQFCVEVILAAEKEWANVKRSRDTAVKESVDNSGGNHHTV
jgi:hypothetical protein